jgi:glycosyltransferase involved in cell wall biosynthesis
MRIIQLIAGNGKGGADRVAHSLGRGLQAAGHEVVYAASPAFAELLGLSRSGEIHWPLQRFRGLAFRELLAFNRRAASADVVLTHDSGSRHFALLAKCLGLRPPLWFMRHCISGTTRFGGVQLHRLLVDHHIAVSDAIRRGLVASGFPSRSVSRIYAGVDLSPFRQPNPATVARRRAELLSDLAPGTVVVGMVARMHPRKCWTVAAENEKGYDVLFQALAKVRFPYRVLIFGPDEPEAQHQLRQMAAFHGARPENLRFAGFVTDMTGCYPLMDINVLPARGEGLGLALIEGMAAGVACIGSRSGGIPEIIESERTGLLIGERDAAGLAAGLERLAATPALREDLARRGQAAVFERFDAPVMVRAFCDLLTQRLPRS